MIEHIKRFSEWLILKPKLDRKQHKPPLFKEREVWWCMVGENIGVEICGKGDFFLRPVLILRKLDAYSFIGTPVTRTKRIGSWYEGVTIRGSSNTLILAQTRHFDYRRMHKIICTIDETEFLRIKSSYIDLFIK